MAGAKDVCDFKKTEEIPGEDGKFQRDFRWYFRILTLRRMTTQMDEAAECGKRCVQVLAWLRQPCANVLPLTPITAVRRLSPPSSPHIDRTRDEITNSDNARGEVKVGTSLYSEKRLLVGPFGTGAIGQL
jgi:hypothetical protein